jgi:hypothetical protein
MTGITSGASRRPFHNVPGRDVEKDRPPDFDIARYYYEQRASLAEDAGTLNALIAAIDAEYDLTPGQWAQWYTSALGFQPDLIVELGRASGNSTALFCQAAARLRRARVVSLCNSKQWFDRSLPRVTPLVSREWLDRLDARIADILDVDYGALFAGAGRVLLLWDAHGFEIAEIVLGRILPLIVDRPHLVLMHDISDTRYAGVSRSYEGQPLWKGSAWQQITKNRDSRVNVGWMNSLQEQVLAISDFATRNDLDVGSADHEYAQYFAAWPNHADEMHRLLGERFFSTAAHWAFLSLAGKTGPFYFPAVQRRYRHECTVRMTEIYPARWWFSRAVALPRAIRTGEVPWAYAAVMSFKPARTVPPQADASLRVRLHVSGAAAGIGVLSPDQSSFVASKRVMPSIESQIVLLPLPDLAGAGPLVIHAWDEPAPARVQLEDIAIVW